MAVGDIYQVVNEFTYQGNANNYIWNLRVTSEVSQPTTLIDLLAFGAVRQTAWLPLHNPSVEFRCVSVRQVHPTNSLPRINANSEFGNRSCVPSLAHLPGQCSCVVTLYGDAADPNANNRGRDFVTGQCCADHLNGVFLTGASSYVEELCALYQGMGNTYSGGDASFEIGVYSPSRAKPPGYPDVPSLVPFFYTLQLVRVRSLVRTQRRRQPVDPCEEVCDQVISPS
jgi:hypothetical protein